MAEGAGIGGGAGEAGGVAAAAGAPAEPVDWPAETAEPEAATPDAGTRPSASRPTAKTALQMLQRARTPPSGTLAGSTR
jgi:hypothetical protein